MASVLVAYSIANSRIKSKMLSIHPDSNPLAPCCNVAAQITSSPPGFSIDILVFVWYFDRVC